MSAQRFKFALSIGRVAADGEVLESREIVQEIIDSRADPYTAATICERLTVTTTSFTLLPGTVVTNGRNILVVRNLAKSELGKDPLLSNYVTIVFRTTSGSSTTQTTRLRAGEMLVIQDFNSTANPTFTANAGSIPIEYTLIARDA